MRWLVPAGLLLIVAITVSAGGLTAADAAPPGPRSAQLQAAGRAADGARSAPRSTRPVDRRATADFRASSIRAGIAAVGVIVFAWGLWLSRDPRSGLRRVRLALLLLLACLAYASYYQFFRLAHVDGFGTPDNFHYYVGSKYFPELGYFGLYECSLAALADRGFKHPDGGRGQARDLRTMQEKPLLLVLQQGMACSERFSAERWQRFQEDVYYFVHRWPGHIVSAAWRDHGYHPSPVWTLIGGSIASQASLDDPQAAHLLSRIDRFVILLGIAFVAWAFGLEVACLMAIVWGTGFIWRYTWVGDAFLRHVWWITAVAGVSLLRRGWHGAGGASLATSALLRIFPGAMSLGYGLHAARAAWHEGRLGAEPRRFVVGAGVATVVLVVLSAITSPQGLATFVDFAVKISDFAAIPMTNRIGLGVLASWAFPDTAWAATGLRVVVLAPFLWLFWRGLRQAEPWEASAFGLCLVPMLTAPTNYYFSFMAICALLAARRPQIGVIVLVSTLAWCLNGLVFYRQYDEFRWASLIAVAACFAIAAGMARELDPSLGYEPGAREPEPTGASSEPAPAA